MTDCLRLALSQYQKNQHFCYNCSHTNGFHGDNSSCTTMAKTKKEWYILGNVKLAEAVLVEPCKCKKFMSKQQAIPGYHNR
jgi:hypothetical protein